MKKTSAAFIVLLLTITGVDTTLVNLGKANPVVPENTWSEKTPVPTTEGYLKAAVVNGNIYAMGGSIHYEYNPASDTWSTKLPMPTPRDSFGIAVYQNKIYVIGGYSGYTQETGPIFSDANEVYDPSTDTWETKKPLPANRSRMEANVVYGRIHLMTQDTHHVYDIANDSWSTGKAMPFFDPAYPISSTVFDDKIFVMSGNQTQIYNVENDTWIQVASSPISVSSPGVCATSGVMSPERIYVFGGALGFLNYTGITQVYNPKYDTWTFGDSMLTPRAGLAAVAVSDVMYAIGGVRYWATIESVNEQYIPYGYGNPEPSPSPEVTPQPETFPKALVIASASALLIAAVVGLGLLVYFKKRHPKTGEKA
jgi:Kelch motif